MRPENVLDDEGIKARFRYSMNCKSEASVAVQAPDGYNSEPSTSSDYRLEMFLTFQICKNIFL